MKSEHNWRIVYVAICTVAVSATACANLDEGDGIQPATSVTPSGVPDDPSDPPVPGADARPDGGDHTPPDPDAGLEPDAGDDDVVDATNNGPDADDDPSVALTTIPEVPFDYEQALGAITASGELPATLAAGTVLEFTGQSVSDDVRITCEGTEENPAFVLGGTLSGANDVLYVSGSWCIFVDTKFEAIQPRTSGDHIIFRDVEVTGSTAKNGMNIGGSNIVVQGAQIHHNQRIGQDAHGIQVGQGTSQVWILDNHIHHNSGNGIQACHECSASPPTGIYIGRNLFHSDREVGVGLKYADNVIIEGNEFHSYVAARSGVEFCFDDNSACGTWNSGSDGNAIVVGADNDVTGLTRVVVVGNEIYGTANGIRIEESDGVQVLSNNIHDVEGRCLTLDKSGMGTVYEGNTCRNAARGIHQHWRDDFTLAVGDNVFENVAGPAIEYDARTVCEASTLVGNEFISSGSVVCGNSTAATSAEVNALPGASDNSVR